jgi:hypothetical protein
MVNRQDAGSANLKDVKAAKQRTTRQEELHSLNGMLIVPQPASRLYGRTGFLPQCFQALHPGPLLSTFIRTSFAELACSQTASHGKGKGSQALLPGLAQSVRAGNTSITCGQCVD